MYGLPIGDSDLRELISSARDVGTHAVGVPMTEAELKKLDTDGRDAFAEKVRHDVLPWLEEQPGYGGVWLDQADNGQLVGAFTKGRAKLKAGLDARMPKGPRGYTLQRVEHTWRQLTEAADAAMGLEGRASPVRSSSGAEPVMSSVDVELNAVEVIFTPAKVEDARGSRASFVNDLGVPVVIKSGQAIVDSVGPCTKPNSNRSQNNCWKPIPPAVRTFSFRNTSSAGGRKCTLGWHVYKASANPPTQVLTAGHCIHAWKPSGAAWDNKNLYHNDTFKLTGERVGVRKATLYTTDGGYRDIARIGVEFALEPTHKMYNHPGATYKKHAGVVANDKLKFYGAVSGTPKTVYVKSAWTNWKSEAWAYNHSSKLTVHGAKTRTSTVVQSLPGDSGAPVYAKSGSNITPVGIVSGNDPDDNGPMVFTTLKNVFLAKWPGWEVRLASTP